MYKKYKKHWLTINIVIYGLTFYLDHKVQSQSTVLSVPACNVPLLVTTSLSHRNACLWFMCECLIPKKSVVLISTGPNL